MHQILTSRLFFHGHHHVKPSQMCVRHSGISYTPKSDLMSLINRGLKIQDKVTAGADNDAAIDVKINHIYKTLCE